MPYKLCSKGHPNGVRSKACKECGEEFEVGVKTKVLVDTSVIKIPRPVAPPIDWAALQKGDRVKSIKGYGPYIMVEKDLLGDGRLTKERVPMGYYGKFRVVEILEDGIRATGNKQEGENANCFLYMGTPCLGPNGVYREAHKLVKLKDLNGVGLNKKRK